MRIRTLQAFALGALLAAGACTEPIAQTESADLLGLSSGTSFGMCAGYCVTELRIEESTVRLTETGWPITNLQPRIRTLPLSPGDRDRIRGLIDVAELGHLEGVHGCPDCADGGAEWIQIRTENDSIRVTFEYGHDLAPIAELQAALREQRLRFPR